MKKAISVCGLLILVAALTRCVRGPSGEESPEVGRLAPNFKLSDLSGRVVSLDQYRGKIVMLDFWATWCGPCRITMPVLENLQKEYPKDLTLLAINVSEPRELVRRYVDNQKIASTVLLDEDGAVGEAYRSESIPMQVLIDQRGVVRRVTVGYSSRLADQLRSAIEQLRHQDF
ncbi:MAG TPA: TlpA disulfide reductase family protein [Acidobacteriota bacterium]|nr:TlpA disulfide reductase family protein [Acidobacteriota bacterium]